MDKEALEQYASKKEELKELDPEAEGQKELIKKLEQECREVEQFIESITQSKTRRIFRMRYIKSMSLSEIGKAMHYDKSIISRKINAYLKLQPMQQMQRYNKNQDEQ